ncbi:hypothetical protein, partial [[Ruminococcus] torques]|uniref:hypothetical protein n=1 Tax=[Ruminococcus] torques TaxID=33039 RepID=UPI0032BFA4DE
VFISEYTAKAFTEPRDYRVVFLIQKPPLRQQERSTRPLRTAEIGRLNYNISGDATAFQPKNIVSSSVSYRNQNICF